MTKPVSTIASGPMQAARLLSVVVTNAGMYASAPVRPSTAPSTSPTMEGVSSRVSGFCLFAPGCASRGIRIAMPQV